MGTVFNRGTKDPKLRAGLGPTAKQQAGHVAEMKGEQWTC